MPPKQTTRKIDVESESEKWGGPTPKELATEPGWLNTVAGEVAEIKEKQLQKRTQQRVSLISFYETEMLRPTVFHSDIRGVLAMLIINYPAVSTFIGVKVVIQW